MYYAIRHKPTGFFLPRFPGKQGGTWVEPTDKEPPRLFVRKIHAKIALKHWLEGKKTVKYARVGDLWGVDDVTYNDVTPVASRKVDEMEIVRIRLEVDHD